MQNDERVRGSYQISKGIYDSIKTLADKDGRSFNNMLERLLALAIKEKEPVVPENSTK